MTVCIVAICTHTYEGGSWPMIVGASDRMYTARAGTWEPLQTKQYTLGTQAVGLFAGVASINAAMFAQTATKLISEPNATVERAANIHGQSFSDYRRKEAERGLLTPMGQTLYSYHSLPPPEVTRITDELRRWQLDAEAIIAGVDYSGPHIYRVSDPGWAECEDLLSFACIGSGGTLASSEFMDQGYTRAWSSAEAMLMVYSAKKRAEVDPYVGAMTDLFVIGPGNSQYSSLNYEIVEKVVEAYDQMREAKLEVIRAAQGKVSSHVYEILTKQTEVAIEQGAVPAVEVGTDTGRAPGGTEEGDPESNGEL